MEKPESLPEETNSPNKAISPEEILLECANRETPSDDYRVHCSTAIKAMQVHHSQQSQADQQELVELKRKVVDLENDAEQNKVISQQISRDHVLAVEKIMGIEKELATEKENSAKLVEALKNILNSNLHSQLTRDHWTFVDGNKTLKDYEAK